MTGKVKTMYTKTTENIKLPQWGMKDHPDWLTDMNEAFQTIDKSYGEQGQVTEEMKENIKTLTTAMQGVEETVASMKEVIDALDPIEQNPTIININTNITKLNDEINTINGTISSHTSQLDELTSHVSVMDSDITTLKTNMTNVQEYITNITTQINSLESGMDEVKNKLQEHTTQLTTLNSTIENINTTLTGLQESVTHAQTTADQAVTDSANALQTATTANNSATTALNTAQLAHSDSENALHIANEAKNIAQEALDNSGSGSEPSDLPDRVTNLETDVSTIESGLTTINSNISTLTEKVELANTNSNNSLNKTNELETKITSMITATNINDITLTLYTSILPEMNDFFNLPDNEICCFNVKLAGFTLFYFELRLIAKKTISSNDVPEMNMLITGFPTPKNNICSSPIIGIITEPDTTTSLIGPVYMSILKTNTENILVCDSTIILSDMLIGSSLMISGCYIIGE